MNKPALKEIAHQFSDIGIMWDEIGTTALHDDIPELQNSRQTALEWHNTFKVRGSSASKTLETLSAKIQAIRTRFTETMPFTNRELLALIEELSVRFHEVYDAEKTALQTLRSVMK